MSEQQGQFLDAWFCGEHAASDSPDICVVCLAAEVEALREKVKQHEVVFKVQAEALKSTREQVQRVRAVADAWEYYASENGNVRTAWAASSVREALDGDA